MSFLCSEEAHMIHYSIEIEIKQENCFLHIFVFAQYFSNALFWVPHIAEIKKSIFYEFDFICMKNAISHIFFSNSSMKKWVTFRKKYYDLYSCGNLKCVVLRNRMRNEKNDKNSCFHLYNTGRNIFWYFHLPLRKRWKKNDFKVSKKMFIPLW